MQFTFDSIKQLLLLETFRDSAFNVLSGFFYLTVLFIFGILLKKILLSLFSKTLFRIFSKTNQKWDDLFISFKFFDKALNLIPFLLVYTFSSVFIYDFPKLEDVIEKLITICICWIIVSLINSLLSILEEVSKTNLNLRDKPIKSYIQVVRIFTYFVLFVITVSVLFSRTPWGVLSGIGALMAVVLLVFKDSILGFVASIQISSYDLIRKGDWIEMEDYKADGEVIEISLNLVKIQNWDKTISSIPTYSLISNSFKNWRGMQDSGGRRIKRTIFIDMTSIKMCNSKLLNKFRNIDLISGYIKSKLKELQKTNQIKFSGSITNINKRQLTNIGTFRIYIFEYLKANPLIRKDMTLLVRQLNPTEKGLPLEVYCFSNTTEWAMYEKIQSDIFDHILSIIEEFELKIFQEPTSYDFLRPKLR